MEFCNVESSAKAVRLLPSHSDWGLGAFSSFMFNFQRPGSWVPEIKALLVLKADKNLFCFQEDLHTFQREKSSGFPSSSDSRRDPGSIPWLGWSPGGGNDNSFQYSCVWNPTDRGAWRAAVHGIAEADATEWRSTSSKREESTYNFTSSKVNVLRKGEGTAIFPSFLTENEAS